MTATAGRATALRVGRPAVGRIRCGDANTSLAEDVAVGPAKSGSGNVSSATDSVTDIKIIKRIKIIMCKGCNLV